MSERMALDGTLLSVPFGQSSTGSAVTEAYRDLCEEYEPENVLVLTGSPTSMETFETLLSDIVPGAGVARVSSLIVHATDIVHTVTDQAVLSESARRELVHRFLRDREWETAYFERVSEFDSFTGDIAQLMETVTWQDATLDQTPALIEIQTVIQEFHDWLAEYGYIEHSQLLRTAVDQLQDREKWETVVDFDVVLAVEFEEFFPLDREYLSALTDGLELVCITERDSSVSRTGIETGHITDHVSLNSESAGEVSPPSSRPEATAQYLSTGTVPEDPEAGTVSVLHADSADEQLNLVADEIERLRDVHDWQYSDFAVGLGQGGDAVSEAIEELTQAGVPTQSTTVTGFGDDPAVRELVQITQYLANKLDDTEPTVGNAEEIDTALIESIDDDEESLSNTLRRWATESGLKSKIAERASPLDARSQFGNVRRVFSMAEFVDKTEFIEASWPVFAEMLERAHKHAGTETRTSAIDRDGGVRVDQLHALKNGSWQVVFVPDVVDQNYPGELVLTPLFPREQVLGMSDFPGVTDVTESEVQSTFQTTSTASSQPITQYHVEQMRRRLAVGANAAAEYLYFCLYDHEGGGLDEQVQPSRFLVDAYHQLPWIDTAQEDQIRSERRATEFALSRIDRALADVRRTQSREVTISLDDLSNDLGEIERVLAASGERGEAMRDALRVRVDFASGRVRRE